MQRPLWRKMGCSIMNMLGLVKCVYRTHKILLKILSFLLYTSPLSVQTLERRLCLSYLQRHLIHLNGRKLDHRKV
jgi:hypothetical protein